MTTSMRETSMTTSIYEAVRNNTHIRWYGVAFGAMMGFLYGLVSQFINAWFLPGLSLYYPPTGGVNGVIFLTIAGGVLGLVVAWAQDSVQGLIAGSILGAFATSLVAAQQQDWNVGAIMLLFLYTFLPRAVIFLPVSALIRWASERWNEKNSFWVYSFRRKGIPVLVTIILAVGTGALSLYPTEVRQDFYATDQLVRAGMQAKDASHLPKALNTMVDFGFLNQARGNYSLEYNTNSDALQAQRPEVPYGTLTPLIIVHYDNGYTFGCVYTPPIKDPVCWIY